MNLAPIRPLGLPIGSIRAILSLVVVVVACQEMLHGGTPSLLLAETLMIVLTYYFTTRRTIQVDTKLCAQLESDSQGPAETNPLWLPRGSVRTLIILAFIITIWGLILQGRLLASEVLTLLGPFTAYLIGAVFSHTKHVDDKTPPSLLARILAHTLALVAIIVGGVLLILAVYNVLPTLPDWIASLLLSGILYYFGSR